MTVTKPKSHLEKGAPCFGIFDLDETIFMHWDGLDDDIYAAVQEVLHDMLRQKGHKLSDAYVADVTLQSYLQHGLPTIGPAKTWGLDHTEFHQRYHQLTFERHIKPHFNERAAAHKPFYRELDELLQEARSLGMRFGVLTHGDNHWALSISELIGLRRHFTLCRGIDGYDGRMKCTHQSLYYDFLREAGFFNSMNTVFIAEDRVKNLIVPATMGIMPVLVGPQINETVLPVGTAAYATVVDAMRVVVRQRREWRRTMDRNDAQRRSAYQKFRLKS